MKRNQLLLSFWLLLFAIITQNFGVNIGVPYLFLDPEYLHKLSFSSMLITGVAFGVFSMSFFISTYILDSKRFNFLGTIRYPFLNFCLNDSIIPILFCIVYFISFFLFQQERGTSSILAIAWDLTGFMLGVVFFITFIFYYFRFTFKFFFKDFVDNVDEKLRKKTISRVNIMQNIRRSRSSKFNIDHYLNLRFKITRIDPHANYDKDRILKVIDQHHLNALSVEVIIFILIIVVGLFRDSPYFQIPAAASGLLFLSFLTMFISALKFWLKKWSTLGFIGLLLILNYAVANDWIDSTYPAFGINYGAKKAPYSLNSLDSLSSQKNRGQDYAHTISVLENWKAKFPANEKPKMVFLCSSGGGQRSSNWSMRTLQYTDSILHGQLFKHTFLITGASGGLIGNCYYRDLYLQKQLGNLKTSTYEDQYFYNMGKDMLNPMIFSLVVNDIFLRFKRFEHNGYQYKKGRGYAFERQLDENMGGVTLDKIMDYKKYEDKAQIPMLIMSPVIINDARKLYLSAQPVSYMNTAAPSQEIAVRKQGVEFMRLFKEQGSADLSMLSALRMSATFPYVTPNVTLPSTPQIEIMDAGLSDNYGIQDALKFLAVFKGWIEENTSGVVFMSVRDSELNPETHKNKKNSIVSKFFTPVGSLYKIWGDLQDFTNNTYLERATQWFDGPIDLVSFQYEPKFKGEEKAALSWHLTGKEKESVKNAIFTPTNQQSVKRLVELVKKGD
ncbi:MAG: patatin-like phospholipase family protein [Cyclobacteriaceae bacterium]